MSFLNGLAAAGAGLSSFAQIAGKEQILDQDRDRRSLANAMSLLNRAPAAPAESPPAAAPTAAPAAAAPPTVPSTAPAAGATPPGTLADLHPDLTHVVAPGGAKFAVARTAAEQFQGLLADLDAAGYKIDPGTSGGYNPRYIAGTTIPSEHAHGLAIDINSARNPRGAMTASDIPPDLARELAAKYGMTWGGDWSGKTRDPMHFEVRRG